jgi:glycosyltransferase 2 family protein
VLAATLATQISRIVAIWFCGEAVGLDLSPLVYVILGPLLFLVMLVPFTINGLGVREAFFVAFLTHFDVPSDAALATGLLFYAVTVASSLPGGLILLWQSFRRRPAPARATASETLD